MKAIKIKLTGLRLSSTLSLSFALSSVDMSIIKVIQSQQLYNVTRKEREKKSQDTLTTSIKILQFC